jgi:predicted transcriptional regulator
MRLAALERGLADVAAGRVTPADAVFDALEAISCRNRCEGQMIVFVS